VTAIKLIENITKTFNYGSKYDALHIDYHGTMFKL